jgi:hypothetical protein
MSRHRRDVLGLLALAAALAAGAARADDRPKAGGKGVPYEECIKECVRCAADCARCYHHCVRMTEEGHKGHARTLQTCNDCGDVCALAARVMMRQGPLSAAVCEGCARACEECGRECDRHPDDEVMRRCAQACKDCARACRDMVRQAGGRGEAPGR